MDIGSFISILGFLVVIGLLVYDRHEFASREEREKNKLLDELTKANTALSAKSAQEYVMMRSMDNVVREEPKRDPEAVDASEMDDATYDKFLKEQLKVGA